MAAAALDFYHQWTGVAQPLTKFDLVAVPGKGSPLQPSRCCQMSQTQALECVPRCPTTGNWAQQSTGRVGPVQLLLARSAACFFEADAPEVSGTLLAQRGPCRTWSCCSCELEFHLGWGTGFQGLGKDRFAGRRHHLSLFANMKTGPMKLLTHAADWLLLGRAGGAMENWGLLLMDPDRFLVNESTEGAYGLWRCADVVCHELAHQWFGNLVTAADWPDITGMQAVALS